MLSRKGPGKRERKWPCPDCPVLFASQMCLVKHASKEHGRDLPLPEYRKQEKCPFCEEIFEKYGKRNNKLFLRQKLRRHLIYSHPDEKENPLYQEIDGRFEAKKFICQDCGRTFPTNRSLEEHSVREHDSHVNTWPCHICGKFFPTQVYLENHIKNIHETSKPAVLCGDCGRTFKNKSDMISHVERIHSSEDKRYNCKECGAEFGARKSLMAHIRRKHVKPREKTEPCSQCQKTFYTLSQLKKHISDVHDKIKAFHCEECQFQCARMDNLNLHRRKSHNKGNITKSMLISMVENDQHPFYTKSDLPMINIAQANYS